MDFNHPNSPEAYEALIEGFADEAEYDADDYISSEEYERLSNEQASDDYFEQIEEDEINLT